MMLQVKLRRKIGTGTCLVNQFFYSVLRINRSFGFPIHFTSRISFGENLQIKVTGSHVLYKCLGLSGGLYIQARNGIYISDSAHIAPGVKIISANHNSLEKSHHVASQPIFIDDGVWIGANAVILPGVSIGANSVIGAGSVVNKSIPENCIAAGVPCIVKGSL